MDASQGCSDGGSQKSSSGKAKALCVCGNDRGQACLVHPQHDRDADDEDDGDYGDVLTEGNSLLKSDELEKLTKSPSCA